MTVSAMGGGWRKKTGLGCDGNAGCVWFEGGSFVPATSVKTFHHHHIANYSRVIRDSRLWLASKDCKQSFLAPFSMSTRLSGHHDLEQESGQLAVYSSPTKFLCIASRLGFYPCNRPYRSLSLGAPSTGTASPANYCPGKGSGQLSVWSPSLEIAINPPEPK